MRITLLILAMFLTASTAQAADETAHGLYLARLGDCASCHTAPGHPAYAGGLPINAPFGTIYASNITPDKDYGIGNYTLDDFKRALRQGIAKDGHYLYPAMPYTSFAGTSDDDIAALYAYFMHGVVPVHEKATETNVIFPFNQRWGIWFWNLFFLDTHPYTPKPDHDEAWNRGAYLAQTLGHCGACHTPRGPAYEEWGSTASRSYLTGGTLDHWHAPNLRGDPASGLGEWSEDDIVQFLKTGHGAGTAAFGNMVQVVENSTNYLTDSDRQALGHYLKSIPPGGEDVSYKADAAPLIAGNEAPGAGLYASACAGCHRADGTGRVPQFPKLAQNPAVLADDPTSVIRVILEGGKTAQTSDGPSPHVMPSFKKLTDREIAEVATYIRQAWGNKAPSVSANEVMQLRKALND